MSESKWKRRFDDACNANDLALQRIAELEALNIRHGQLWADLDRFLGAHRRADEMTLQEAIESRITELERALADIEFFEGVDGIGNYRAYVRNRARSVLWREANNG